MDQLPRLWKRELICLLLFTCNYVVSVWRGFIFLWVLGMGYVILLWHSLSLPYNNFIYSCLDCFLDSTFVDRFLELGYSTCLLSCVLSVSGVFKRDSLTPSFSASVDVAFRSRS